MKLQRYDMVLRCVRNKKISLSNLSCVGWENPNGEWVKYDDVEKLEELNREMLEALIEIKEIAYTIATNKGNLNIDYVIDFYKEVGNNVIAKAEGMGE